MKKIIYLIVISTLISLANYFNAYSQVTPPDNSMVTGFDVEELVTNLLPEYKKTEGIHSRGVTSRGAYYGYWAEAPERPAKKKGFSLLIGVFKDANEAAGALKRSYDMLSMPPPRFQDEAIGDEMCYSESGSVIMRRQNVFVSFSLGESPDKVLEIAREIDKEIQAGGRFVTRGLNANFPRITFEGVPAKIKKKERAPIKIKIENVDPANVLISDIHDYPLGSDSLRGGVSIKKPAQIMEVVYGAPDTIGKKTIHISVATPENLITTETFTIEVEE